MPTWLGIAMGEDTELSGSNHKGGNLRADEIVRNGDSHV